TLGDGYVLDLGGGSLQLVAVAGRIARHLASWPVGTVRMSERFLPGRGRAKRKQLQELREHLGAELRSAPWLLATGGSGSARRLQGREPPVFEDVRRASVMNLAASYHADPAHTRHVAALALGMFDELARLGLHPGDPRERELLWAASMLHDIGMSVDYDDHHKHSRYLILNGGLPGFAPVETAIIAQAARYHRKGMPVPGPLAPLFGEGDAARLDRSAVLLRLAEDLERSRDQLVRSTS